VGSSPAGLSCKLLVIKPLQRRESACNGLIY
jgi:hypothetical protein